MATKHYVIGISGGSGSGKTSLLRGLKENLSEEDVCFISLDNYYLPRDKQAYDDQGIQNFDLPESIDAQALRADIDRLLSGESVTKTEYVFNNEQAVASTITLKPAKIFIIEGLFIYHYESIRSLFDLKVFVHAKDNIKLIRRIKRDRLERNYPVEDVIYRYEHHVLPSFEKYIDYYREDVDVIINNNKSYEPGMQMLEALIEKKIKEI